MIIHQVEECHDCAQKDAALGVRYRELAQLQKLLLAQQARLETDLAARKAAEQKLAQMQGSLSWRVTAPLRRLARLLRRR